MDTAPDVAHVIATRVAELPSEVDGGRRYHSNL